MRRQTRKEEEPQLAACQRLWACLGIRVIVFKVPVGIKQIMHFMNLKQSTMLPWNLGAKVNYNLSTILAISNGSDILNQETDSHSASGCMSSHSCQSFWSSQTLERDSQSGCMFSHSCQWFWSAQTLERDSLSGCMFSNSCQWFWSIIYSNTGEGLTTWIHVQPFLSVILICSNTGEGLTAWMHV